MESFFSPSFFMSVRNYLKFSKSLIEEVSKTLKTTKSFDDEVSYTYKSAKSFDDEVSYAYKSATFMILPFPTSRRTLKYPAFHFCSLYIHQIYIQMKRKDVANLESSSFLYPDYHTSWLNLLAPTS